MADNKLRFDGAEMALLKGYERQMRQASRADYCSPIPYDDLRAIRDAFARVTGDRTVNISCGTCVVRMMKEVADIYASTLADAKKGKAGEGRTK